jgi:hypothetical protein
MRQTAQFGLETVYGTPVAVTKRFTSFGLGKERNMGVASSTPRGQTAATQGWVNTEDSAYSIEDGVLSFDEVVWLLNSGIKKVAPSLVAGGTTAQERIFRIDQFAADAFASYSIEQGDVQRNRGGKAGGCTVQEWGFAVSSTDDSVGMTGNLVGWKLTDGPMTDLGAGSAEDFQVVIPKHFKLYYASTWAELQAESGTEVVNAFTAEFGVGDRRNLVRYLGKADGSPSDVVETPPSLTFDLTLADEAAPVDTWLASARAGQKIFFRLQALHPDPIEAAIQPEFCLDLCSVLRDGPSDDDEDGVQVVNFPLQPAYDAVSDEIFNIKVVNAEATPA